MARLFVYDGRQFPDPNPDISVDEVRRQLSVFFPELTNADVREERRGEDTLYTFSKRIGTKGRLSRVSPSDLAPRPSPLFTALRQLPHAHLRVFELAESLMDAEGELDVEAAGLVQPDIALALAEADRYAHATRQAVQALRRLM